MVALNRERRVFMWHIRPHAIPQESGKTVTLDEIASLLKTSYDAGEAEMYISDEGRMLPDDAPEDKKNPKNRIYIADFEIADDAITLLINRGDTAAADPAYINANTKQVNPVRPGADESQGWSAHLVVRRAQREGLHRACFERMPRSTSSYAESLISKIIANEIKGAAKYTYKKLRRERGITIREAKTYRPVFGIRKVPSDTIMSDLEKGEISGVTLLRARATLAGLDAPDVVKTINQRLIIKTKPVTNEDMKAFITSLTRIARREGYNQIQIGMEGLPGGTSASPKFSLDIEDATEVLYARTQLLTDFPQFLESCYGQINGDIKNKLKELISDNDQW
jgi:hypothetical protein